MSLFLKFDSPANPHTMTMNAKLTSVVLLLSLSLRGAAAGKNCKNPGCSNGSAKTLAEWEAHKPNGMSGFNRKTPANHPFKAGWSNLFGKKLCRYCKDEPWICGQKRCNQRFANARDLAEHQHAQSH